MISFRHKGSTKRVKIKTNQRLDERMSHWLQKVFAFRGQIIGFKASNNKYYDVETFYGCIDRFFGMQVQIVQASDQMEISFTSDNLNSSSFIRPSQPNTSQLNPRAVSSDQVEEFTFVSDIKAFERRLQEGKDISILFDTCPLYRKQLLDSGSQLMSSLSPNTLAPQPAPVVKISLYLFVNSHNPKKSCFSIYAGRTQVVTVPLTSRYKALIKEVVLRLRRQGPERDTKPNKSVEDEAPSFTTYHLQQRLNQQACGDYLQRMHREKLLRNYEYYKLSEKLEDFSQFYRLFCDGVIDNDYESFKNELLGKVENNLELILSNVDEMDLSRPISREEQRKQNLKKSVPAIEIVKVENYFQILDQLKHLIDPHLLGDIKQLLLEENDEICSCFSQFLARDCSQYELAKKLTALARLQHQDIGPLSRCVPRPATRTRSMDEVHKAEKANPDQLEEVDPPMFGLVPMRQESPIQGISDLQSSYKHYWQQLSVKSDKFSAEEYGMLYYFLQNKDACLLALLRQHTIAADQGLAELKKHLRETVAALLQRHFTDTELEQLESIRNTAAVNCVYEVTRQLSENFRYESDPNSFLNGLREELNKHKPAADRTLHKKSSDSQLLENNKMAKGRRKYSDEQQEEPGMPSPKDSEVSLYQKESGPSFLSLSPLRQPWKVEFEEMLSYCNFKEIRKEEYLREAYLSGNPSVFLAVQQYLQQLKLGQTYEFPLDWESKDADRQVIAKVLPVFYALLGKFVEAGLLSETNLHWATVTFLELNPFVIAAFQSYLHTKEEKELCEIIKNQHQQYLESQHGTGILPSLVSLQRIERLLQEMSTHDKTGIQMFQRHPQQIRAITELYYNNGDIDDMLDSLDTLYETSREDNGIRIATLNFSGINTSPLQYDDGSEMMARLNANLRTILDREMPQMTDWGVGKIDKVYQTNRQGVGFSTPLELTSNNTLPNREQFNSIWLRKYAQQQVALKLNPAPAQAQVAAAIAMDFAIYRAVVQYVYKLDEQIRLEGVDGAPLLAFLATLKDKPSCRLDAKQAMVYRYLSNSDLDVLCLQEAGGLDWTQLPTGYRVFCKHDSVIIYRQKKLGGQKDSLMEKYSAQLDFNSDSAVLFTDRNFLVISAHLKSSNLHIAQAQGMFEQLSNILDEHPLLKIMIGIDANHFIPDTHIPFRLVPSNQEKPTTIKKRTYLQAQFKKAGEEVRAVKDHLIAKGHIEEFQIEAIDGKQTRDELLPNDRHPYDHYIVRGTILYD